MFIIYVTSPTLGIWEYYDTWKADSGGILLRLINFIIDYDDYCDEFELLNALCHKGSFSGINVKIYWEENTYGIR